MTTYKSPDVYVEEISLFPPSVAEVETAIPAFIGYTKKADRVAPNDLANIPTKVASLLEYEELFGGAPPIQVKQIVLDENNVLKSSQMEATFYLYDSLRLFFKNGGGRCYIVSVGSYEETVTKSHFLTGLQALRKQDEPTIILFPDAVLLESNGLYDVQQQALTQCNDLQDRFTVCDLLESRTSDATFTRQAGVKEFRNNIGINDLKYGAAYTPWLRSNLGLEIHYRDVRGTITRGGQTVTLKVLTDDAKAQAIVSQLDDAVDNVKKIDADLKVLQDGEATLGAKYVTLSDAFKSAFAIGEFKDLFKFIYSLAAQVDQWAEGAAALQGSDLPAAIKNLIANTLKASLETLIAYDKSANTELTGDYGLYKAFDSMKAAEWGAIFAADDATNPVNPINIYGTGSNGDKRKNAEPHVTSVFYQVNAAIAGIVKSARGYESTFEKALYESHAVYKSLIRKLGDSLTTLPPSGAVAGVYASVDNTRGVWKAPANVSLAGVVGITEIIDSEEQEGLNVDAVAGKSINAIRPFTGKGVLVWGARTLAGNDNEWRYISVRRFFNMVEESVKKSTYWAVFEPNDANTWVKVKSMIENYLIQKWRDGALAGAKPDQAFYVKVGLGTTMTQQDILEGLMNVEIGMAVVRPAEFIVLKFSHKMQES